MNSLLVVGSIALDTVETPFGRAEDVLGGSAVYFSAAASLFAPVQVVGVVGGDYPLQRLEFLRDRGVDTSRIEIATGRSFRWSGIYDYDLASRDTLSTELGVFATFDPEVPADFRAARRVFLANIDPRLQLRVLDQVEAPEVVICDTMNYWIDREREALVELLSRIDLITINDAEARELADDHNLARAARWIQDHGPRYVIIKKGEHGAMLFSGEDFFFAPGYPLEEVFDPTGAGDAFTGGLLGHLARVDAPLDQEIRRAVVVGCALGSFACEDFGPERLADLTAAEVDERVLAIREMTRFELFSRFAPVGRETEGVAPEEV